MNITELKTKLIDGGCKILHEEEGYIVIDINGVFNNMFITYNNAGMRIWTVQNPQIEIVDMGQTTIVAIGDTQLNDINKISYIELHLEEDYGMI